MESDSRHTSITLPRSFQFHYHDMQPPRTPEPEVAHEDPQPPPPPRAALKVRRRRTTAVTFTPEVDDYAGFPPIPTIEAPELHAETSFPISSLPALDAAYEDGYLSPGASMSRMLSPPKTPVSQIIVNSYQDPLRWCDMELGNQSETSSRPTSSSGLSDWSVSSRGSFEAFPTLGGSRSPEEDQTNDAYLRAETRYPMLSSPLSAHTPRIPRKKIVLRAAFTEDMDRHLWMTYMTYLQDPTVTPFKALPTTVPPNGVCHRVARQARKTWKGPRATSSISRQTSYSSRCGTPDTIKPAKSGSCTPVPGSNKTYMRFPSEKSCRKRLRDLAKQKPSFSAHYQRMLHRRSPSPFQSSPQPEPSQPNTLSSPFSVEAPSFSTRDMNVSLATSTASSMQFGNPLSQITSAVTPQSDNESWSGTRLSAHQKSQSLHIGLGLGIHDILGSSFSRMSEMTDNSMNQHNAQTWHAPPRQSPKLGSPLKLHAPRPISRPFKRRALHNFEEQVRNRGNSFVDQLFGAPAESSHRRVRSRGFSLGDMMEGARRLPLTTSGVEFDPFATSEHASNNSPSMPSPQEPTVAPRAFHSHDVRKPRARAPLLRSESDQTQNQDPSTIRLGSPFKGEAMRKPANRSSLHTFPRASTSYGFEPPASFEERFSAFPSTPNRMGGC